MAVLAFFFLVLTIGGLSSFQAWSILSGTQEIQEQGHHIQLTEAIHVTIHQLIREVDRAVMETRLDREIHMQQLAAETASRITAFVHAHLKNEAPSPERDGEIEGVLALEKLYHDLEFARIRILARVADRGQAAQEDLQTLDRVAHRLPVLTDQITEIHHATIRRLVGRGVSRMKVIAGAYLAFLVVGVACVIGGIVRFSQTVVLPLCRLASTTQDIAAGDFQKRVPILSRDEIGRLSQSFNEMAERLERRETELRRAQVELSRRVLETRALYHFGVEISSTLELDKILRSVVEKARALLQSEGAALCLFRPQGDGLETRIVSDSKPMTDLAAGMRLPWCLTEVGQCLSPDSELCSARMILDKGSRATGLAAALKRGEETLGALCVGWKEARCYQREDRELLEGLAAQAAIAIENARLYREVKALAALQERERLAREMHDGLAQAVGYIHFRLKTLEDRLEVHGQAPRVAELSEMRATARKAYEDIRQSLFGLRTGGSKSMGLIPILTEYLHEFSQQSEIPVELQDGDTRATRFSAEAQIQIIRVIQEALTNVRKHANARRAWVRFALDDGMGRVTIADDGVGFIMRTVAGADRRRFGLGSMRERIESLGGRLEIHSAPRQGTQVVARIPLA